MQQLPMPLVTRSGKTVGEDAGHGCDDAGRLEIVLLLLLFSLSLRKPLREKAEGDDYYSVPTTQKVFLIDCEIDLQRGRW
jgi:hypothetical protein